MPRSGYALVGTTTHAAAIFATIGLLGPVSFVQLRGICAMALEGGKINAVEGSPEDVSHKKRAQNFGFEFGLDERRQGTNPAGDARAPAFLNPLTHSRHLKGRATVRDFFILGRPSTSMTWPSVVSMVTLDRFSPGQFVNKTTLR